MIKKVITIIIVLGIMATVAYQMGWLSYRGESLYDDTKDTVLESGKQIIDKGKDAVK